MTVAVGFAVVYQIKFVVVAYEFHTTFLAACIGAAKMIQLYNEKNNV